MSTFAVNIGKVIIGDTEKSGRPMTEKESTDLMTYVMLDTNPAKLCGLEQELMEAHPIFSILSHRIKGFGAGNISTTGRLFLATLAGGSPGNAVLYAAVAAAICEGRTDEVSLTDIIERFPFAVPTEDILHRAWDRQKGLTVDGKYHDNALDAGWAWSGPNPV